MRSMGHRQALLHAYDVFTTSETAKICHRNGRRRANIVQVDDVIMTQTSIIQRQYDVTYCCRLVNGVDLWWSANWDKPFLGAYKTSTVCLPDTHKLRLIRYCYAAGSRTRPSGSDWSNLANFLTYISSDVHGLRNPKPKHVNLIRFTY